MSRQTIILKLTVVQTATKFKQFRTEFVKLTANGLVGLMALFLVNVYNPVVQIATEQTLTELSQVEVEFQMKAAELGLMTNIDNEVSAEQLRIEAEQEQFYEGIQAQISSTKSFKQKVAKLESFFKRYKAPIANSTYAEQIIRLSEKSGADYKVVVAIMGVESGFCIAPYKKYNCFGYLNGVQYTSFSHAFEDLVPKVSRQYAKPYGTNFSAMLKAYGVHNVDAGVRKMNDFYALLNR